MNFRSRIKQLAEELGLIVTNGSFVHSERIQIEFSPHFPMWVDIDVDEQVGTAVLVGVVRTTGLLGDRSDYHDLLSLVWAAVLRSMNLASVRLVDIPHPAVEGELYGRYVLFDRQPPATYISLQEPNYDLIADVLVASQRAAFFFSLLFGALGGDHESEGFDFEAGHAWAATVARQLSLNPDHLDTLNNKRLHPTWSYYRRNDRGIVAFNLELPLTRVLPDDIIQVRPAILESIGGQIVDSGAIKNVIPEEALRVLLRLTGAYSNRSESSATGLWLDRSTVLLPIESHLICVTNGGIMSLESDCGYRAFLQERDALLRRHQTESRILFSSATFAWHEPLDDELFERLILDLLNREPGVTWARKVGQASASDAGRDVIAEWYLGPAPWQEAKKENALERKRIVVQCKGFKTSINLSKLSDISTIVDFHNAQGYLLVAYPTVTPQVVDYMNSVPARRNFWADWWTQAEIEDRLRANLDIAERYPDLLSITRGASESAPEIS
jgi:hypothetical protein